MTEILTDERLAHIRERLDRGFYPAAGDALDLIAALQEARRRLAAVEAPDAVKALLELLSDADDGYFKWRDRAEAAEAERDKLQTLLEKIDGWLVCAAICTAEDFMQNVEPIHNDIETALTAKDPTHG